jgi:hypothetical protein
VDAVKRIADGASAGSDARNQNPLAAMTKSRTEAAFWDSRGGRPAMGHSRRSDFLPHLVPRGDSSSRE